MDTRVRDFNLGYGDYLRFRDLVLERTGLYFPEKKKSDLEAGLGKALVESPLGQARDGYNLDSYYHLLSDKNNPAGQVEMERLIKALTIGETHFFRDEPQFDALANHVLPALIARKRAAAAAVGPDIRPQLRLWSAGCASGEEPYSLAILLKELIPDIEQWYIHILATDINQEGLSRAREAVYSEWSFRENRAKTLRNHYFIKDTKLPRYRLRHDIPAMVAFASLNLIEDTYPAIQNNTASMDLILCRNVTIYFHEADTRVVVDRFYRCLVEGGWLVVGHSEPSLVTYRAFQAVNLSGTILYQKTGRPMSWPDDWRWLDSLNSQSPPALDFPPAARVNGNGTVKPAMPPISAKSKEPERAVLKGSVDPEISILPVRPDVPAGSTETRFEVDPYEIAQVLLNKGQTEEAIQELYHKLAGAPDFAPAHSLLGRAYANLGKWEEARRWCESALRLSNLLAETHYVLALINEQENQLGPAIDALKKAIYLERDGPLYHFNLALLYRKTGQLVLARRSGQNTIKILEKWPPASIVPDTGGATAKHLLEAARRIMRELTIGNY